MKALGRVLVFGGTHGNEWTGVYAVEKFATQFIEKFKTLEVQFHHANPEAFKINKRFKDEDLNRAFEFLHETRPNSYEHRRARQIKALIEEAPCFVVDLHTTTSNMGSTVILTSYHPLNLWIASQLKEKIPDCRIIGSVDVQKKYLSSQSDFSMMIEVGPVANGVINATALSSTLHILENIFDCLSRQKGHYSGNLEIFEETKNIFYPLNERNELDAYIHCDFQDKDFGEVEGSFTAFKKFSGEEVQLQTDRPLYPIFINEAAYYPQHIAFNLCEKVMKSY